MVEHVVAVQSLAIGQYTCLVFIVVSGGIVGADSPFIEFFYVGKLDFALLEGLRDEMFIRWADDYHFDWVLDGFNMKFNNIPETRRNLISRVHLLFLPLIEIPRFVFIWLGLEDCMPLFIELSGGIFPQRILRNLEFSHLLLILPNLQ